MSDVANCRYGGFDEGTYEQFEEYVKKVDEFKVKLSVPAAVRAPILSCASSATLRGNGRTRLPVLEGLGLEPWLLGTRSQSNPKQPRFKAKAFK